MLLSKETVKYVIRAGKGTIRTEECSHIIYHALTSLKLQKGYQNKLIFNGTYSRNNLPKEWTGLIAFKKF